MKERSIVLLGGLGALLFVLALFGQSSRQPAPVEDAQTSQGEGASGYAVAWQWLEQSGVRHQSLRQRYDALDTLGLSATGNLLIISEPAVHPARPLELEALSRWLAQGNDLLLVGASAAIFPFEDLGGSKSRSPSEDRSHTPETLLDYLQLQAIPAGKQTQSACDFDSLSGIDAQGRPSNEGTGRHAAHPKAQINTRRAHSQALSAPITEGDDADDASQDLVDRNLNAVDAEAQRWLDGARRMQPNPSDANLPLLRGVTEVRTANGPKINPLAQTGKPTQLAQIQFSARPNMRYAPDIAKDRILFVALCDIKDQQASFWQFRYQHSRIFISAESGLFSNRALGKADNAVLLANLINLSLGPQGTVVFDDMHQGDSVLYDPKAFFADPRLHQSLWLLFAIWLLYLVGSMNRFAPVEIKSSAPTPARFARSLGGYLAKQLHPAAAAQALRQQLETDLRREGRQLTPEQITTLNQAQSRIYGMPGASGSKSRDLRTLAAHIQKIRQFHLRRQPP